MWVSMQEGGADLVDVGEESVVCRVIVASQRSVVHSEPVLPERDRVLNLCNDWPHKSEVR